MKGALRVLTNEERGGDTPVTGLKRSSIAVWAKGFMVAIVLVWAGGFVAGFQISLMILTAMGFAATIAGFWWPALGLLGVGMLCTIDPVMRALLLTGGLLRWNTLNYLLILYIIANLPTLLRLHGTVVRLQQAFAAILVCWLLVTPDLEEGVSHLLNFISSFALIIFFVRSASDREVWFWMAMVNGVLAGLGGLLLILQRSSLPYVNPNAWMLFPLAAIFSAAMAFFLPLTKTKRATLGVLALINAAWIYLSASRGGLLTAAVVLLFMFVRLRSTSQRLVLAGVAASIAVVITTLFVDLDQFTLHRLEKLFSEDQGSVRERTSGRSYLALGGWYIFLDHPLGVGTGGYATAWSDIGWVQGLTTDNAYGQKKAAHAGWIKVLVENGVLGILVFAAFVASFAAVGWAKRKRGRLWIGLLVTSVFTIALISTEFQSKALWLLASGGTVLLSLRNEKKTDSARHVLQDTINRQIRLGGVTYG